MLQSLSSCWARSGERGRRAVFGGVAFLWLDGGSALVILSEHAFEDFRLLADADEALVVLALDLDLVAVDHAFLLELLLALRVLLQVLNVQLVSHLNHHELRQVLLQRSWMGSMRTSR